MFIPWPRRASGRRRANVSVDIQTAHNKPTHGSSLYILWLVGPCSARIRSLHFGHILARLCSPKRRRWPIVTRNWARAYWIRRRVIGWGSVVRIQRVWRKSLPVIRRKEDIFRFLDRKISCSQNHALRGRTFGGFETKDLRQTLAVIQSHPHICKVSNRLSATWPNFA